LGSRNSFILLFGKSIIASTIQRKAIQTNS
jgi:hypothetical protein